MVLFHFRDEEFDIVFCLFKVPLRILFHVVDKEMMGKIKQVHAEHFFLVLFLIFIDFCELLMVFVCFLGLAMGFGDGLRVFVVVILLIYVLGNSGETFQRIFLFLLRGFVRDENLLENILFLVLFFFLLFLLLLNINYCLVLIFLVLFLHFFKFFSFFFCINIKLV